MTVTRYYGELAEVYRGKLTKHCFVAGMRVASFSEPASGDLAALFRPPLVEFARASVFRPAVVLLVGEDAQCALALGATIVLVGLIVVSAHRRKRVVGIALRRGHILLLVLAFGIGTLPLPLALPPLESARGWRRRGRSAAQSAP